MDGPEKRDLLADLTHTVKEHPVESLLAYEILVPKKKKEELEGAAIGIGFVVIAVVLVLPLLFAPAMEPWLCKDLKYKACGAGAKTVEDIERAERKLALVRLGLWITAIVSWIALFIVLYLANNGLNLERY